MLSHSLSLPTSPGDCRVHQCTKLDSSGGSSEPDLGANLCVIACSGQLHSGHEQLRLSPADSEPER